MFACQSVTQKNKVKQMLNALNFMDKWINYAYFQTIWIVKMLVV